MPLLIDAKTGDPYIQLPPPLTAFRITIPRVSEDDITQTVRMMNDPLVYKNLNTPPYPHSAEHAREFLEGVKVICDGFLEEMKGDGFIQTGMVSGSPFMSIREVKEQEGVDRYIGYVRLMRTVYMSEKDPVERERLKAENYAKEAGDPTVSWMFAVAQDTELTAGDRIDILDSEYHGRGIMSAAIRALIHEFGIPHLNVKYILAEAFADNPGSTRVFIKNGFTLSGYVQSVSDLTHKGRTDNTCAVLEWRAS